MLALDVSAAKCHVLLFPSTEKSTVDTGTVRYEHAGVVPTCLWILWIFEIFVGTQSSEYTVYIQFA